MAAFKLRAWHAGPHVHAVVFAGSKEGATLARCGRLCFRKEEWVHFRAALEGHDDISLVIEEREES